MVRDLARSFAGADTDGNHRLSFDEFLNAVPAEMRTNKSTTQLQQMFANVDADGSGTVSIDEFFIWTMFKRDFVNFFIDVHIAILTTPRIYNPISFADCSHRLKTQPGPDLASTKLALWDLHIL